MMTEENRLYWCEECRTWTQTQEECGAPPCPRCGTQRQRHKCTRCGWLWTPTRSRARNGVPRVCPHCKTPYWNRSYTKKGREIQARKRGIREDELI